MPANYRVSSVAALLIACGGTNGQNAVDRSQPSNTESEADTQSCVEGTATSGWVDGNFPQSSGVFSVELDATPGSADEDALVGLAENTPGTYTDLAAIVRFNSEGKIDARDGDSYHAYEDITYQPGQKYHLLFNVDTVHHTYLARYVSADQSLDIARDFAFRSEQANAEDLSSYGVKVDAGGPLDVCNVIVRNPDCTVADAGQGFVNLGFAPVDTFVTIDFNATPSAPNIDIVMGVSESQATSFNDIAAAVRFNPDGQIDARDGDVYREIPGLQPYVGGTSYHFELLIDVLAHTYTVAVDGKGWLYNLAFRTQQAQASSLANLVLESDAATGAVSRCAVNGGPAADAVYMHDGINAPVTVALPDGRYMNVLSGNTTLFDAQGFPAGTAPVEGPLGVDAAGNLYRTGTFAVTYDTGAGTLTSAGGVDAFLVKYDAAFNPVWSARYGGSGDDEIGPPIVNANGDVVFVLNDKLAHVDPQGNLLYYQGAFSTGAMFALAPDGSLFECEGAPGSSELLISKRDPGGNQAWTHPMPVTDGRVDIQGVAADATGGVVFAGGIDGQFDLGGGHTFAFKAGEDGVQAYIAKLDANGDYVYANATDISDFEGLTVDGLGNAAISGEHVNAFFGRIEEYRANGELLRELGGETLIPIGYPNFAGMPVVADWTGNLYWSFRPGLSGYDQYFVKVSAP
jgi:hypothetical protein